MGFRFDYFISLFSVLLPYLSTTMLIAVCAFGIALVLSLVIAATVNARVKGLYAFFQIYLSFFRSTPVISQLFFFYFGLSQIWEPIRNMSSFAALVLILSMNESAFMAESLRGAYSSIEKGQFEACQSIGMTTVQSMRHVILPQVIRVAIPSLSNSFICLIKGSSIGFTIGVLEMMTMAKIEIARTYRGMEAYIAVLIIYWVVIACLSFLQKKLEIRMGKAY